MVNTIEFKEIEHKGKKIVVPMYVKLSGSEMILKEEPHNDTYVYYRDGGAWSVNFRVDKKGKLFSIIPVILYLHDLELIPITEKVWEKGNRGYV